VVVAVVIVAWLAIVVAVMLLVGVVIGWASGHLGVRRPESPLGFQATVALHDARTRLDTARAKAEIRATSSRLRRELDRELQRASEEADP